MQEWVKVVLGALIGLFMAIIVVRMLLSLWKAKRLMDQFKDEDMVETILEGKIARGMTYEMVVASWGEPADVDETVLKTKTKRELKYDQKGKNRYETRVQMEDGVVVGWETK